MLSILNHQAEQEDLEGRSKYEMADIFRHYGEEYRIIHLLPPSHLKVMHDIEVCRTAYLGGHIEKCDSCGLERHSYNSCRNRHCPKCQSQGGLKLVRQKYSPSHTSTMYLLCHTKSIPLLYVIKR